MPKVRVLAYVVDGRVGGRDPDIFIRGAQAIEEGLVDFVIAQGTGMDYGPWYMGVDEVAPVSRVELEPIVCAAVRNKVPFIYSFGGYAGADIHMKTDLRVLNSALQRNELNAKVAVISGEIGKEYLKGKVRSGARIHRSMETPRLLEYLSEEEIDRSKRIQAQMGPEPIMEALQQGVDGVVTGRALDLGLHMAPLILEGVDKATAAHVGKVVECGSFAATVANPWDMVIAEVEEKSFTVRPLNPEQRCTIASVYAHALYEREDPSIERNPGGVLDVSEAVYEQVDERTVRASGAKWHEEPYTVKLEGVAQIGMQCLTVFGIRDPDLIAHLDFVLDNAKRVLEELFADINYSVVFHVFGRDGVLGPSEPLAGKTVPHELALSMMTTAATQHQAERIANTAKAKILLGDFPGRKTTAGNAGFTSQPISLATGPGYIFNIWHLLPLSDPCEPFLKEVLSLPVTEGRINSLFGRR